MSLLKLAVSFESYSCISNKFQSCLMQPSILLKKSSKSYLRVSLIKMIWFLSAILCFVRSLPILFYTTLCLCLISSKLFSISFCREVLKSNLLTEFSGTTGCSRWFVSKHLVQIFSWHFRQNKMKSYLCEEQHFLKSKSVGSGAVSSPSASAALLAWLINELWVICCIIISSSFPTSIGYLPSNIWMSSRSMRSSVLLPPGWLRPGPCFLELDPAATPLTFCLVSCLELLELFLWLAN